MNHDVQYTQGSMSDLQIDVRVGNFRGNKKFISQGLKDVKVYVNEIVRYGRSEEEHDRCLRAILLRLAEYGVGLNYGECKVAVTELDFIDCDLGRGNE